MNHTIDFLKVYLKFVKLVLIFVIQKEVRVINDALNSEIFRDIIAPEN